MRRRRPHWQTPPLSADAKRDTRRAVRQAIRTGHATDARVDALAREQAEKTVVNTVVADGARREQVALTPLGDRRLVGSSSMQVAQPGPALIARAPVIYVVFDLLHLDGASNVDLAYEPGRGHGGRASAGSRRRGDQAQQRVSTRAAFTGLDQDLFCPGSRRVWQMKSQISRVWMCSVVRYVVRRRRSSLPL